MRCILRGALCFLLAVLLSVGAFQNADAAAISAKAYILINADTGEVLEAFNAHKRMPMASTTKLMTALILAEQNTPDKEIVTTAEMVTVEGSSMGLLVGDSVSYYELLVGMLLPSGNDAANTAAISVAGSVEKFAELMNQRAKQLGMNNTNFITPSGLDAEDHYSTAFDMALLARAAMKNTFVREIVSKQKITVSFGSPPYQRTLYNHNKLLERFEYCIGVKTGYTKKSGRCLVSCAEKDGCRVIAVTLNAPDDWNDHTELLTLGLSRLTAKDITADVSGITVPVAGGDREFVSVSAPRVVCGCTDTSVEGITYRVTAAPFLYAPVSFGQTVGYVEYFYNGDVIFRTELPAVSGAEIKTHKFSFFEIFKINILNIFKQFV